jgi:Ca2+-binding RTX toxin-like protein
MSTTTYSLANSTTVAAAAPIDATLLPSLEQSIGLAQAQLQKFASNPEFSQKLAVAFGDGVDLAKLQADWLAGDFSILSGIEIRTSAELGRAKGAYSAATDTIYLSQEFWAANQDRPEILAGVLLEEVGHRIDARVNTVDSVGDEGEFFARIVQSIDTSADQIESIHADNDHAIVILDGREISIEEAGTLISKAKVAAIKDGIDRVFTKINDALGQKVFAEKLPFIGDNLKFAFEKGEDAFVVVQKLRDKLITGLDKLASINTNITTDDIKEAIDTALTAAGFQNLANLIEAIGDGVEIEIKLKNPTVSANVDLSGDFGLPNLGLKTTGTANAVLDYNANFNFGVDTAGFYFNTDPTDGSKLDIKLATTIPNFSAAADFGPLKFTATDNNTSPSSFIAKFDVGFKDPDGDNRLRLTELGGGNLLDTKLTADAKIDLKLKSALPSDTIPSFNTNLAVAWNFNSATIDADDDNRNFGSAPKISLKDSNLDLGSFFGSIPRLALQKIQQITSPIQPIIDVLTEPIPVLSELKGKAITLLDLIGATPGQVAAVRGLADIALLSNTVLTLSNSDGVALDLGSVTFDTDVRATRLADAVANVSRFLTPSTNANAKKFLTDVQAVRGGGLSFPILTDETAIAKLILGQNVDLFKYQPTPISLSADYKQFFPIIGPIGATFAGKIGFALMLDVGFDTKGLREYLVSQPKDPATIFNGFYLDAFDDTGKILTGGELQAGIIAGVAIDLVLVEAGIEGDITANIDFGFNQNIVEPDGKIRGTKLATTKLEDLFQLSGELSAGLRAYLEVGIGPFSDTEEYESPRVTLLSYNKDKELPILGTVLANNSLRLNLGPNSIDRLHGNITDGAENFTITEIPAVKNAQNVVITPAQFVIGAFRTTNTFNTADITQIVANGGERADIITANDSVSVGVVFNGGASGDSLSGGKIADILNGDEGNDVLKGNGGDDTLRGGSGKDVLIGGGGADLLDGGADFDIASYETATAGLTLDLGAPQNSTGEAVGDTYISIEGIKGTKFNDNITGDNNSNSLLEGLDGNDSIQGLGSADFLSGSKGNDTLQGGFGDDFLTGGADGDALDGGEGTDTAAYIQSKTSVNVSLKTGIVSGGDAQGDTLTSIESLMGSLVATTTPGTRGDTLEGNDLANVISGLAGNDYISGLDGDDFLYGETADNWSFNGITITDTATSPGAVPDLDNDTLLGGAGNDRLSGQRGNDNLDGGVGNDTIDGGEGSDTYIASGTDAEFDLFKDTGTTGTDTLTNTGAVALVLNSFSATSGIDAISGAISGNDNDNALDFSGVTASKVVADGGKGNDSMIGTALNDDLRGNLGNDSILGGAGNDTLTGGVGIDTLNGGEGSDTYIAAGTDAEFDIFKDTGTTGTDTLTNTGAVALVLNSFSAANGIDAISGAISGNDNDNVLDFSGITASNVITDGKLGNDSITGGTGKDTLDGGAGQDTLKGGSGDDYLKGGIGDDNLDGGSDNDVVDAGTGIDVVEGGTGNDLLILDYSLDENATTGSATGTVSLTDAATGASQASYARTNAAGAATVDSVTAANIERVQVTGTSKADSLTGGVGDDNLKGGGGNDTLIGSSGSASGNDTIDGGEGNDEIVNRTYVDNTVPDLNLIDFFDGGAGFDTLTADFSNQTADVNFTSGQSNNIVFTSAGTTVASAKNFEAIRRLATGSGNDTLVQSGRMDNIFTTAAGNDKINPGVGRDSLDAGAGNDLLILDYSLDESATTGGVTSSVVLTDLATGASQANYARQNADGTVLDTLIADNIEQLQVTGTSKDDILTGGVGADILNGGAGNDTIKPGVGRDNIDGGTGNDLLILDYSVNESAATGGVTGTLTLINGATGASSANFRGSATNSSGVVDNLLGSNIERLQVTGTSKNDSLSGSAGDDILNGGAGNDTLIGSAYRTGLGNEASGNDIINGGEGDDEIASRGLFIIPTTDNVFDRYDGGAGFDTLSANFSNQTADVNFTSGQSNDIVFIDGTFAKNFEAIRSLATGSGNDTLVQSGRMNNNFITGAGNDTVNAGLGDDSIDFGAGNDLLILDYSLDDSATTGVIGSAVLTSNNGTIGSAQYSRLNATGNNSLDNVTISNVERFQVTGASKNDSLTGGGGDDILNGGAGNDTLIGSRMDTSAGYQSSGNDILNGGDGDDEIASRTFYINNPNPDLNLLDKFDGGTGFDTLSASFANQTADVNFIGGQTNDITFTDGTYAKNFEAIRQLITGSGNDTLVQLGRMDNNFRTGAGNDTIDAGVGNDTIDAGTGNDLLILDYSLDDNATTGGVTSTISLPNAATGTTTSGSYSRKAATGTGVIDSLVISNIERLQVTGTSKNDSLSGGAGDDILNGGAGNDTLIGSTFTSGLINKASGNDIINGGEGDDEIASRTYSNNFASGPDLFDRFDGGAGVDTLSADFSNQIADVNFIGGQSNDIVFSDGTFAKNFEAIRQLITGSGNETLVQLGRMDNSFSTGAGNDTIDAGMGNDTIDAGTGNDLLILDYSLDDSDATGGVTSTISASTIAAGTSANYSRRSATSSVIVDSLTFTSIERLQVTGTSKDDILRGGVGGDIFKGLGGNDTITGGGGINKFIFSSGRAFNTADLGIDTITDFQANIDSIVLNPLTFGTSRTFDSVTTDDAAALSSATIVYNSATGNLFYNPNGSATGFDTGGQFATLSNKVALTANDIKIQGTNRTDFNGDRKSDILWRNNDGSIATWQMNGSLVTPKAVETLSNDWQVAGTGDFNADRTADLLWRNTNGNIATWQLNNSAVTTTATIGTATTDWQVAGTGDFNGDSTADVLWRNDNGSVVQWQMNGGAVAATAAMGTATADWKFAGTGDLNSDGKADVLWHNDDGRVALWQMDGATVNAVIVGTNAPDWKIVGNADFNGDGKSDLLWRNSVNGSVAQWQMNGSAISATAIVGSAPTDWQVIGTGDVNGDDKADILWRNTDGGVATWQMNGANVLSAGLTSIPTADSAWKIAAPIL